MTDTIIFIILAVSAYLIGSLPAAYLVVKWRFKKDIRNYGSGQVGGSNVFRNFSKRWGFAVGIYDLLKGVIFVLITQYLGFSVAHQVVIGILVIAGHNWPVFLKFNAGRGVATALGVCFVIYPFGIWIFLAFAIFTLLVKSSPLPALIGMAAMPVSAWLRGETLAVTLGLTGLLLIIIIRRLIAPLTERSKNIPKRELFLNRFLFDRDIRDAKTWVKFRKPEAKTEKTEKE
ncbi:MAG TPA: glycerol-3-phosphate acyltransferase [Dehalococcoidales bacterium]|nr:glycerol-3-phosphate acyltransferase [Dehalococcoidales bacterium]